MTSHRSRGRSGPRRVLAGAVLLCAALVVALPSAATASGSAPATTRVQTSAPRPSGPVTFGVRPAGPKAVDQRTTWSYQRLAPGQVVVDHVGFVNSSTQPATFTVYAADGENTTAGGFSVVPSQRSSLDLGTWVTLARPQITVPARSTVIMPFRLAVPRNAEPGDHAGGIVASLRTYAKDAKGNTVAVDSRVGARLYARVNGPLHPRLAIERLNAHFDPGGVLAKAGATVTFTVRNEGNVRLVGHQSVRISDLFGASAPGENVPDLPELLPKNSFTFSVRVHGLMPVSYFTARVTVDPESVTGNIDPALAQASAQDHFLGLSYTVLALVAAVLLGLGLLLWRRRRGRRVGSRPVGPPDADDTASAAPSGPAAPGAATGSDSGRAVPVPRAAMPVLRPRTAMVLWLAAAAALPAVLLGGPPAHAAVLAAADPTAGSLTFVPAKGADIDPMYAVLSGPCPAAATHTVGVLTGQGFPAEGINVVTSSTAGMRHDVAFGLPLQNTLKNFAAMSGVRLLGSYTLRVRCVDRLATKTYATFTGVITFRDATHFTAPAPAQPPAYGVPVGFLALTFPEVAAAQRGSVGASPGASAGTSAQQPLAAGSAGPAAPQSTAVADAASAPAAATTDGSSSSGGGVGGSNAMALLSVVALIGAAGLFIASRRGRQPRVPEASTPRNRWPDEEKV